MSYLWKHAKDSTKKQRATASVADHWSTPPHQSGAGDAAAPRSANCTVLDSPPTQIDDGDGDDAD